MLTQSSRMESEISELTDCKILLVAELKVETDNIDELTGIIQMLKRNLHEEKKERERAVQASAKSAKLLRNAQHIRDVAREDSQKFLSGHRHLLERFDPQRRSGTPLAALFASTQKL